MGLPGLNSKVLAGLVPSGGSTGDSVFLLFPGSSGHPHSLAHGKPAMAS